MLQYYNCESCFIIILYLLPLINGQKIKKNYPLTKQDPRSREFIGRRLLLVLSPRRSITCCDRNKKEQGRPAMTLRRSQGARARPAPTAKEARPQEHGGTGRRGEEDWAIKKEVFSIADWEPRSHAYFYIQEDLICQLLEDEELR